MKKCTSTLPNMPQTISRRDRRAGGLAGATKLISSELFLDALYSHFHVIIQLFVEAGDLFERQPNQYLDPL